MLYFIDSCPTSNLYIFFVEKTICYCRTRSAIKVKVTRNDGAVQPKTKTEEVQLKFYFSNSFKALYNPVHAAVYQKVTLLIDDIKGLM